METMHDFFLFEAMLRIQWDTELYDHLIVKMANNDESPSDFMTIECKYDYDWVYTTDGENETEIYRKTITDFYIFTEKRCYTFAFDRDGEKYCMSAPRNPLNGIPFGVRVSNDDSDNDIRETEVQKHVDRLNKEALALPQNKEQ